MEKLRRELAWNGESHPWLTGPDRGQRVQVCPRHGMTLGGIKGKRNAKTHLQRDLPATNHQTRRL